MIYIPMLQWFILKLMKIIDEEAGRFMKAIVSGSASLGIVVTDRNQHIIFSNQVFTQETGYSPSEIIGKNSRILQGSDTDQQTKTMIRKALNRKHPKPIRIGLLNYRKDGSSFWNSMFISPLFDASGQVSKFVGIQVYSGSLSLERPLQTLPWISQSTIDQQKQLGIVTSKSPTTSLTFITETNLPTLDGTLRIRAYRDTYSRAEPLAMVFGDLSADSIPLRVHDQCFTSEVLGSLKCDCKQQLDYSIAYMRRHGGVVVYLQQEGRGMGLANKLKAYHVQEFGLDTVDANRVLGFEQDTREYDVVPLILDDLGVRSVRLMTNNPRKIDEMERLGISIVDRIPIGVKSTRYSDDYLKAKVARMGHLLY